MGEAAREMNIFNVDPKIGSESGRVATKSTFVTARIFGDKLDIFVELVLACHLICTSQSDFGALSRFLCNHCIVCTGTIGLYDCPHLRHNLFLSFLY